MTTARATAPENPARRTTTLPTVTRRSGPQRLEPLVAALEAQPGPDYRELARVARQVATTRV
ncbi:MAG: hypothetical protein LC799_08895 [Actinobacteria bacterium]|nr:hypothetical protein [Actinomycetota bacterium]